jgi:hypothetical protein
LNALQNKETSYFDDFYNWVISFFKEENVEVLKSIRKEKIDDVDISRIKFDNSYIYKDLDGYEDIAYKEYKDYTVYCVLKNKGVKFSIIQTTNEYKGKTSKDLYIGLNESRIFSSYGTPSQTLTFSNEKIHTYFKEQISFIIVDNRIEKWFVW